MNTQEFMEDMKQLLRAEISGAVQQLEKRMDGLATKEYIAQAKSELRAEINDVRSDVERLRIDMSEQFNTVLDAVGERFNNADARAEDHEHRIQRLERHVA